jgi:hypothetical protein
VTLKEMILSSLEHISGRHHFPMNKSFKQCAHEELKEDRLWLDKESPVSFKKI